MAVNSIEDLEIYQEAMKLGDEIWEVVSAWGYFAKDTVGKQLVRSADSMAANLSEGFGRYHFKENQKFCYYSRGSISETVTWVTKAQRRGLVDPEVVGEWLTRLDTLTRRTNAYIRSIGQADGSSR